MEPAVAHQIWNYIGMLGVDRETARDLYQEAEVAIWDAAAHRATSENHSYLVKTGIGAIRHWLRDRYALIRIPGYLHDRGKASDHMKTMLPLDDAVDDEGRPRAGFIELVGDEFTTDLFDRMQSDSRRSLVMNLLHRLTPAERDVMELLLAGRSVRDIAHIRRVRVGCVYAQRAKAIMKLQHLVQNPNLQASTDALPKSREELTIEKVTATLAALRKVIASEKRQGNRSDQSKNILVTGLYARLGGVMGLTPSPTKARLDLCAELFPKLIVDTITDDRGRVIGHIVSLMMLGHAINDCDGLSAYAKLEASEEKKAKARAREEARERRAEKVKERESKPQSSLPTITQAILRLTEGQQRNVFGLVDQLCSTLGVSESVVRARLRELERESPGFVKSAGTFAKTVGGRKLKYSVHRINPACLPSSANSAAEVELSQSNPP